MAYTYSNLQDDLKDVTYGHLEDEQWLRIINRSIRSVVNDCDLRTLKRRSALSPFLFDDIYDYSAPSDLKTDKIIDIIPQVNRSSSYEYFLLSPEEFDRKKYIEHGIFCISQNATNKTLRIAAQVDDTTLLISGLDSTSDGGGVWEGFGDGTNLTSDSDYFVKGSSSINWDINADGGTTAGIQNSTLDEFDITEFISNGNMFVWVYIQDTTDITNFIMRIGNDSSNYYTKTVTTTNEGTAFANGWNLLRFNLATSTETGSVTDDECDYVAVYMTKDSGKVSETDYRFDQIQIKKGVYHELDYYSKYPWTDSTGATRKEDSTASTDLLVADADEYELFILKAKANILDFFKDVSNLNNITNAKAVYREEMNNYQIKYPSEAKVLITNY